MGEEEEEGGREGIRVRCDLLCHDSKSPKMKKSINFV